MNFGKLGYAQNICIKPSFCFPKLQFIPYPLYKRSLCGGGIKSETKVSKASRGLNYDVMMQNVHHTKKRNQIEGHTNRTKGDMINMNDLLFNEHRKYLIRCDDSQQVNAEELSGKVIVLYMVPLYYHSLDERLEERMATTHLIETYNYLLPHHAFEVVMVAQDIDIAPLHSDSQTNNEKQFEAIFSRMPWTAIPYADKTARERISRRFGIPKNVACLTSYVIDSSGMLLQSDCLSLFDEYGGLGYPFSNAKIEYLNHQDDAIIENPSLKMLLGSPERNYVISNRGDMVPIDSLEERVIALYFYEEGVTPAKLTYDIVMAYEEFSGKRKVFEVVLIYLYDTIRTCGYTSEESFYKTLTSMPWLALPFKDPTYRNLKRLFGHTNRHDLITNPALVMLGPHGEFIEPWGAEILIKYKLPAYPFTREEVAKIETERVKELKLEMLWDPSTLFRRNDGTEVPFAQIAGKRTILFFEGDLEDFEQWRLDFLAFLSCHYDYMKHCMEHDMSTDDEFEVIYISSSSSEGKSIYQKSVADTTWLYARESDLLPMDHSLYRCYSQLMHARMKHGMAHCHCQPGSCATKFPTLLAFERDGRLVRKSIFLDFDGRTYDDDVGLPYDLDIQFPFSDLDMEEEALMEINRLHLWKY